MGAPTFDTEGIFDEDYLYFYDPVLPDERSRRLMVTARKAS